MAEKNQMISHLKNAGERIHSMVTPWMRSYLPGSKTLEHLPGQNLAVGIKARIAAKKMRFLHPENQGSIQPETILQQAKAIKDKTSQYHQLLHVTPNVSRDSDLWSKVEQVLPSGTAPEPKSTPEPGVMQQGSIIPKMSMFPQKGQSISDFKDQIQSSGILNQPKPAARVDKKPRVLPNSRIFARVEEFSNKEPQEMAENENADGVETPTRPPEAAPKSSQLAQADRTTVQRQVDAQEIAPARQVPVPPSRLDKKPVSDGLEREAPSNPTPQAPSMQMAAIPKTDHPGDLPTRPTESPTHPPSPVQDEKVSLVKMDLSLREESKPARMEPRSSQPPAALPLRLPAAQPAPKKTEQPVPRAKAVPLTPLKDLASPGRPPLRIGVLPPARPGSTGSTGNVVQRQAEHKAPAQSQKRQADAGPVEHHPGPQKDLQPEHPR